jgi:heat shock protein HslJ
VDGDRGRGDPALTAHDWLLTDAAPLGAPLGAVTVTARFTAGSIMGTSGCNMYSAPFGRDGATLTVGPDIAATMRACEPPTTAVETAYLTRLARTSSYRVDGERLTLRSRGGERLVYEAADGAAALGGTWRATSLYTGTAVSSVVGNADLTLGFGPGGELTGRGGCNRFRGPYEVTGRRVRIGPLVSTATACANPLLTRQETDYLRALELARSFRVGGGRLELLRAGGAIAATFERAPGPAT